MHSTGHARIEGMHRTQDFQRLLRLGDRRAHQRGLVGAWLALRIARAGVPRAGYDALILRDPAAGDVYPVAERAARRLVEAGAETVLRPGTRIPFRSVLDAIVAPGHAFGQRVDPHAHRFDQHLSLDGTRGDAPERGKKCAGWGVELGQRLV